MSLKTYKKSELKTFAEKLGIDANGFKPELEDRLSAYLDDKKIDSIEDVPELADHFSELPTSPSTAKKARKSLANALEDSDSDLSGAKSLLKTVEKSVSKRASKVSQELHDVTDEIELSPAKVAQWANDTTSKVFNTNNLPRNMSDLPNNLRSSLSHVSTVALGSISVEAFRLIKALIPMSYEFKLGGFGSITLPDVFVFLLGDRFWKPMIVWLAFQLVPLFLAVLFNLRADSTPRKGRKPTHATYVADPVTYAVAKLLMVYLAYNTAWASYFGVKELALLQMTIGTETMIIGSSITLLFALYAAVL